jgi:hypothetical protein
VVSIPDGDITTKKYPCSVQKDVHAGFMTVENLSSQAAAAKKQ